MVRRTIPLAAALLAAAATLTTVTAGSSDTLITNGSPTAPFSQSKQNEPTIAVDAHAPNVLVAGANDNVDLEACNAGDDTTCPFTQGVGTTGVYFSFDSGTTWTQPTYTGLSARGCLGTPGPDAGCTPQVGPISTLPWYSENGLVADGDPGVAIGPKPGPGGYSWANGSRLYFSNLTANVATTRSGAAFRGFEAIAVSRTDDMPAAAAGVKSAWMPPVLVSAQSSTTFSDKSQVWADNASSSRFFGTVYVCWGSFAGQEKGKTAPAALNVATSRDGGQTWAERPVSAAADNGQRNPLDGCTIRTDSAGNAYLFGIGTSSPLGKQSFEMMSVSRDGGNVWSTPAPVVGPVNQPGTLDPVQGRAVIDGVAGARSDLAPAPSVDIANGAPTGADATDRIVMSYVSGPLATPQVFFTESTDRGASWSTPRSIGAAGDRGYYTAPAISPNGSDVYVVYNAFTTPFRIDTTSPRSLVGVVVHADTGAGSAPTGTFAELHRGAPGDPRSASANGLTDEFLGDYVYATATRTYGAAVWNDVRNGADCPAIDAWRMSLQTGAGGVPRPAPEQDCPPAFGNSDIYGGVFADPTP
ncbi:MAG TPA: sialidase family protein [Candidatus Dormibacteraeota bacterium]|nr:sialidase family protein [Candidatus Dormibacteraeota bacterium]